MTDSERSLLERSVFLIPALHGFLLYAPLHGVAALIDKRAAQGIQEVVCSGEPGRLRPGGERPGPLSEILALLASRAATEPQPRCGPLAPAFLGLIPTRACNLACAYCGFLGCGDADVVMDLNLAREAIGWYLDLVSRAGRRIAEVHFFGGEPFCAAEVVDLAVHFARLKAADLGCDVRFEVATNGVLPPVRARWAADSLDSVVLSLDGPPDLHNRHRADRQGRGSSAAVMESARILSEGAADLSLRVCVTRESLSCQNMAEVARWLCEQFRPAAVALEPLQPTARSDEAGLHPPDPWKFAAGFVQASRILAAHGVQAVYAAADIQARRVSFCPVGQDVPIVSPGGSVCACYLLPLDWEANGLDLRLGTVNGDGVCLDGAAVEAVRAINVWNKPFCERCFCRWHCAGGCHVHHQPAGAPGAYDDRCIQTRAIALDKILSALGREVAALDLLKDFDRLAAAVLQPSDRLGDACL